MASEVRSRFSASSSSPCLARLFGAPVPFGLHIEPFSFDMGDCPGSQEKYLFRLVKTAELCDKGEHEIIA